MITALRFNFALIMVLSLLAPHALADAPLTKEKLKQLVESKIDTSVIVALIEKDCVAFDVDSDAILDLRHYPPQILTAALKCRKGSGEVSNPNISADVSTLLVHVARHGTGPRSGPWGIFVPYAVSATNGWDSASTEQDLDANLGVLFTAEEGTPSDILAKMTRGEQVSARFVTSCLKDTSTTRTTHGILPVFIRAYGCYWSPDQTTISLNVPSGAHMLRAITMLKLRNPKNGFDSGWVSINDTADKAHLDRLCPHWNFVAETHFTVSPRETRDVTFSIATAEVKVNNDPGVCTEMTLQ